MTNSEEQIKQSSEWIVKAFLTEGLVLDYSIDSLKLVDKFMDDNTENGNAKPNGILSKNKDSIIYGIGAYLGETLRRNIPGTIWKDEKPHEEDNPAIILPNGVELWPIERIVKRYFNGPEDSVLAYGIVAMNDLIKNEYWEGTTIENNTTKEAMSKKNKPWWKLW